MERHDTRGSVAKNPAKSQTRLSPERRAQLVIDYEAGMPVSAIASMHRVHRGSIPKLVLSAGGSLRVPGLNEDERVRAKELYEAGHTLEEVGRMLGVDAKTVRNALVKSGCVIRPRGRRRDNAKSMS